MLPAEGDRMPETVSAELVDLIQSLSSPSPSLYAIEANVITRRWNLDNSRS
jgi:hypothetical protein